MKILKAEEGKIYQSLIDSSVYATTIYLAGNDSESNYKLINESDVVMTTNELEEDDKEVYKAFQDDILVGPDASELLNNMKDGE